MAVLSTAGCPLPWCDQPAALPDGDRVEDTGTCSGHARGVDAVLLVPVDDREAGAVLRLQPRAAVVWARAGLVGAA